MSVKDMFNIRGWQVVTQVTSLVTRIIHMLIHSLSNEEINVMSMTHNYKDLPMPLIPREQHIPLHPLHEFLRECLRSDNCQIDLEEKLAVWVPKRVDSTLFRL